MQKDNEPFLKRLYHKLKPPLKWQTAVVILTGIIVGLGAYIIYISNAVSYLSDDPKACINCHVMVPQYATWERGSHGRVATCNDCHVPHDNELRKYAFKASDGMRHAYMFTFRLEPQVIRIHEAGKKAVQENCIRCHQNQIHPVAIRAITKESTLESGERYCWDCHRETPHGRVNGLASTPHARVKSDVPSIPGWIKEFTNKKKIDNNNKEE